MQFANRTTLTWIETFFRMSVLPEIDHFSFSQQAKLDPELYSFLVVDIALIRAIFSLDGCILKQQKKLKSNCLIIKDVIFQQLYAAQLVLKLIKGQRMKWVKKTAI